ncbi:hypothetical protein [Kitasatospora sp. NBC_01539]|uniref:hypothetical protein n=1 Tax=Kitasatospora sp. NBC_01539 TaxID=2903577 RepID=UPI00386016F1
MATRVRRAAFFDLQNTSGPQADIARGAMARHRAAGDILVLVLPFRGEPAATTLFGHEADLVLHVEQSRPLTAGASATVDAAAKSEVIVEAMTRLHLDAVTCFGYGDHCGGKGLLCVVGNPRVVGYDAELLELARLKGWPMLDEPALDGIA